MDDDEKKSRKMGKAEEEKFLRLAEKRLKRAVDADSHNRSAAIEDLNFLNGDQWDDAEVKRRKRRSRPTLMVNLLPKYVDQIVGEERHNRPRIKIRPVDSRADINLAKIREGIIRNVEYLSNAEQIYDQAFEMAASCGYGAWRILTRYTEENPFVQEIYKEAIRNPFLVYMDPSCKDAVCADAKFGFVLQRMPKEEFEEKYPDADISRTGESMKTGQGLSNELWYDKSTITVAEYFVRETETKKMSQLSDGTVLPYEDAKKKIKEWEEKQAELAAMTAPPPAPPVMPPMLPAAANPPTTVALPGVPAPAPAPVAPGGVGGTPPPPMPPVAAPTTVVMPTMMPKESPEKPRIVKSKDTEIVKIRRYIINAFEVIEGPQDFPGKFIPIVVVTGKERNIEGKRFVRGMIRDAKDPQRIVNYWESSCAETVALAPKAPWLATPKMLEGFEDDYANAHIENFPYLKYNVDPSSSLATPTRSHPGEPPVALFAQRASAHDNLKNVLGLYNSDMGDKGPERSAPAIIARQTPGDVGTFAFLDNLSRSIAHSGRIVNEMIPEIYDTERDVRLRNVDDTETFVPINTTAMSALKSIKQNPDRYFGLDKDRLIKSMQRDGEDAKFNDITIGKYDVVVSVGPSYTTQRQESSQNIFTLINSMPDKMGVAADILVENMDFLGSERLARRLRKSLPPQLVEPKPGEPPQAPMPPPLPVQVQFGKLQVEKMKVEVQKARMEIEKVKALKELSDTKGEVRQMVMGMLKELMSAQHPADEGLMRKMTPQEQTQ